MSRDKRNRPAVRLAPKLREEKYVRVAPGNLDYIKFGRIDMVPGRRARKHRIKLLERAANIGQRLDEPVEIFFRSRYAKLKVRETIKEIKGNKVVLGDGRTIPIKVITSIRYIK